MKILMINDIFGSGYCWQHAPVCWCRKADIVSLKGAIQVPRTRKFIHVETRSRTAKEEKFIVVETTSL
jgi:hypothetical protein